MVVLVRNNFEFDFIWTDAEMWNFEKRGINNSSKTIGSKYLKYILKPLKY